MFVWIILRRIEIEQDSGLIVKCDGYLTMFSKFSTGTSIVGSAEVAVTV